MSTCMPIATSTPMRKSPNPPVLKEKKQNDKNFKGRASLKENRTVPSFKKPTSKENKTQTSNSRKDAEKAPDKEAQRRQQALEAMRIFEQRRQRMSEELPQTSVETETNHVKDTQSILMEKKRQEAKKMKERRVLAFLAEQELKKKKQAQLSLQKCQKQEIFGTSMANYRARSRCSFKPKLIEVAITALPVVAEEKREDAVEETIQALTGVKVTDEDPTPIGFIRYSKDDIRSMNPYGFYFL